MLIINSASIKISSIYKKDLIIKIRNNFFLILNIISEFWCIGKVFQHNIIAIQIQFLLGVHLIVRH